MNKVFFFAVMALSVLGAEASLGGGVGKHGGGVGKKGRGASTNFTISAHGSNGLMPGGSHGRKAGGTNGLLLASSGGSTNGRA